MVALVAADGPAGGERLADGLVTAVAKVVGEQAGQVPVRLRRRRGLRIAGARSGDVELLEQFACAGGIQDAADGLGRHPVSPCRRLGCGAFPVCLDDLGHRLLPASTKALVSRNLTQPTAVIPEHLPTLTTREREVMALFAMGLTNDEIA
ncbi:hypothetical protein ACFYZ2_16390 [Streptomyces sviceus]|uniref:helix-turn-helix transcriptional regulator n=1 Tax=Streptomyces sviceus TaxID=285530 RepID=UPI0036CD9AC2